MEEAERLADRIVIIDHGSVVASGTLAALVRLLPPAQTLHIDIEGTLDAAVLHALAAGGARVRHLSSGRANLEDVFLALTGRQLRD